MTQVCYSPTTFMLPSCISRNKNTFICMLLNWELGLLIIRCEIPVTPQHGRVQQRRYTPHNVFLEYTMHSNHRRLDNLRGMAIADSDRLMLEDQISIFLSKDICYRAGISFSCKRKFCYICASLTILKCMGLWVSGGTLSRCCIMGTTPCIDLKNCTKTWKNSTVLLYKRNLQGSCQVNNY